MKPFTFQAPPNILFEAGASKKLAELVSVYGAKRILLVTDTNKPMPIPSKRSAASPSTAVSARLTSRGGCRPRSRVVWPMLSMLLITPPSFVPARRPKNR